MPSRVSKDDRAMTEAVHYIHRNPDAKYAQVARDFGVCWQRLRRRAKGVNDYHSRPTTNTRISDSEEAALCRTINKWDLLGLPRTKIWIKSAANWLIKKRNEDSEYPDYPLPSSFLVGTHWISRFLQRHPEFIEKVYKPMDYKRKQGTTYWDIKAYFDRLETVIHDYNILQSDCYNWDETGFRVGCSRSATYITSAANRRKPVYKSDPNNRESLTSIECVAADGHVLPPLIIVSGKILTASDIVTHNLPDDYAIAISESAYTNDEITLDWVKHFNKHTINRTQGEYRLLISDGFNSHSTFEIIQYCEDNKIIPFCLPPHSTHLLQPLDVKCFHPLKRQHQLAIDNHIMNGLTTFTRRDFLASFKEMRLEAFKESTIKSGFYACGIWPLNPAIILDTLDPPLHPHRRNDYNNDDVIAYQLRSSDAGKTPECDSDVERREVFIQQRLQTAVRNNQTPQRFANIVDKYIKHVNEAQAVMLDTIKLANRDLQIDLEVIKARDERRQLDRRHVAKSGVLSMQDARHIVANKPPRVTKSSSTSTQQSRPKKKIIQQQQAKISTSAESASTSDFSRMCGQFALDSIQID